MKIAIRTICTSLVACALVLGACSSDGPTSPSFVGDFGGQQVGQDSHSEGSSGDNESITAAPGVSGCLAIQVDRPRSRASASLDGNYFTATAFAESSLGSLYVRLYYDSRGGQKIGDFKVNEPFTIVLSGPGAYRIQADVEFDGDGNGLADAQCDGLFYEVVVPEPPTPPEEPPQDPPSDPEPPEDPPQDPPEDPEPPEDPPEDPPEEPRCEDVEEGTYPKQGNPEAECSYFGNYVPSHKEESWPWDQGNGDFYLCKAGQDLILRFDAFPRFGIKCPNGKEISHITTCVCAVD